jgi:thiamine pyrophosphate-dependent acetolactate synthase large subunit-like protein
MNEADALLVFGASFSNHTGIAPYKPIVQVDFDPMAIGRFHPVTVGVLGDVGVTARALLAALPPAADWADQRGDIASRWELWRAEKARRVADDRGRGIGSAVVFEALSRLAPPDAVITVDVGNHAYSFGRYFECDRQTVSHVRLSGLDRLWLPGGDGRVGGRAGSASDRGHG